RDIEKQSLKPLLPSVYEQSPGSFIGYDVKSQPYVLYRSCRYSIPQSLAYSRIYFKVVSGKIYIYDNDRKYICVHNISERKGSFNQLPEHKRDTEGDWITIAEELRSKWNCYDFQHFINGVKRENSRHTAKQLKAINRYLDAMRPDKTLVAEVMEECCENYRYTFSQFKTVFDFHFARLHASSDAVAILATEAVEYKGLDTYEKAFNERIAKAGVTV
ncbi:MAG: hypothetical protein HUJ76_12575, partial [Parasporobacterium sp.]|nr:hypothetical protein [Parasporobacterium sp.]